MDKIKKVKISLILLLIVLLVPFSSWALIPNDPGYFEQWYLNQIRAPEAWNITTGSSAVVIAIIDSGFDMDHPDLVDNYWVNKDEIPENGVDDDNNGYIDDIYGWDFVLDVADPNAKLDSLLDLTEAPELEGVHHGSIVAGIASAIGNNDLGIAGIGWRTKIMALRALNNHGEGDVFAVRDAIDYAIDNGADIINLSFAGEVKDEVLRGAVKKAYQAGLIIVAAAGNDKSGNHGQDLDVKGAYPVCHDGERGENMVIGVAATDTLDQRAPFSYYGKKCIDLAAPGIKIFSTVTQSVKFNYPNYYRGDWAGTSLAVPMVAGTAALIKAVRPDLSNKKIAHLIINNTDNIDAVNPGYKGKLGGGRLNVWKSVQAALDAPLSVAKRKPNFDILTAPFSDYSPELISFDDRGEGVNNFLAYGPNFKKGFFVAADDVDGNGLTEIITGAGLGGGPQVRIFNDQGQVKSQFFAYDSRFRGGVRIATGDVDGDGRIEIITAPGKGGGPHIRIFNDRGEVKSQFFAYDKEFHGGISVATGDLDNDGLKDIIVGLGGGVSPYVRVFDHQGNFKKEFLAYEKNFRGGVNVAAADLDKDNILEIITAPAAGYIPQIRIFKKGETLISNFLVYNENFRGGVNLAVGDINNDGRMDIVTGAGLGGGPQVRIFDINGSLISQFFVLDAGFRGGINVGAVR